MNIIKNETAAGKATVTVAPAAEEWKAAQEKAFRKLSAKVSVPGFRPGKAPEKLLRERVSQGAIFEEAAEAMLNPTFIELLNETKIEPFTQPMVRITKISDTELELVYEIILVPTVELGKYKGLKIKKDKTDVSEKEVDEAVKKAFEGDAVMVNVDREAKSGDTLILDFKGLLPKEDGTEEAFDGGTAENYSLTLGSNTFVPGFEDALIGVKAGEHRRIAVKFPENYVENLAGKDAYFECDVHEVKERQIPEATDEAAKALGLKDVETLEQLKAYEKDLLARQKENTAENKLVDDIITAIVKDCKFTVAEEIYDNEAKARLDRFKKTIENNGFTYEQYLQLTGSKEEELLKTYKEEGIRNIQNMLVLAEIAKAENIAATDEEVEAEYKRIGESQGVTAEEAKKHLKERHGEVVNSARSRKLIDYLKAENAA